MIRVGPSVRTRQLTTFINLGMLELTYRLQTFRDYSLAVKYLIKNEATLYTIPERQCVHFKHADFVIFDLLIQHIRIVL